ncbi:hypothetical protein N7478_009742 [Penicillium angulare]|uniref:uncharacterized protein n=1 Tax=Penicillium angulare TaxID=116970 RepID=UPI002541CEAE|nr:uncharacterized protein N7478_009742 [Penicillium angulare]KAJ5266934.1 hypothetical protein N7478_009742 [Penicillium angulare]
MAYTIYDGFVLQAKRTLTTLSDIIHKAEEHPDASKFPTSRLYPDMRTLSYQVAASTVQTLMVMAKLTNQPFPDFAPDDVVYTYPEMYERIESTLKVINEADKDYIIEHAGEVQLVKLGPFEQDLSGYAFASMMQANIFFHVSTAYGILRKEGVPLGKRDFITPFFTVKA